MHGRECLMLLQQQLVHCAPFVFDYFSSICRQWSLHNDVIKWKHFPRYWPFVRGIHMSPVNSPHKGQWRGALMFSLICFWINNGEAGDLRRHRAHHNVTVMVWHGPIKELPDSTDPRIDIDQRLSRRLDVSNLCWFEVSAIWESTLKPGKCRYAIFVVIGVAVILTFWQYPVPPVTTALATWHGNCGFSLTTV